MNVKNFNRHGCLGVAIVWSSPNDSYFNSVKHIKKSQLKYEMFQGQEFNKFRFFLTCNPNMTW